MSTGPRLPVGHYALVFHPRDDACFTRHAGSAWRGAFGHALKRTACVTREPACPGCLLFRSCPYPYVFETPPPEGTAKMRLYTAAPHPFVIAPPAPGVARAGADYALRVTLFGHANRQLPYIVHALASAGEAGIGAQRTVFDLAQVRQQQPNGAWQTIYREHGALDALPPFVPEPPPVPGALTLTLETPLRLKRDNDAVTPQSFRFGDLFSNLLRRISLLTYFHTDIPLETDFAGLTRAAREQPVAAQRLHWVEWTRYSSRQKTAMQMGGLVGSLWMQGPPLAPFWPYLWLGQWTHAGKATSMGLGAYRIEAASLPENTAASP